MAKLYIVATPIGNLDDITLRAIETLKEVDIVACEDTRQTLKLLNHLGVKKKLVSYHSQNERSSAEKIIRILEDGKNVALVSDGGTPGISDPGSLVVRLAREEGFEVTPIPGVSAVTALMSVSGFPSNRFCFYGFLSPSRGKRRKQLKKIMQSESPALLFESPFRVVSLLREIVAIESERKVLVGREITKIHEEFFFGTASLILTELEKREKIRGEFCILIEGSKKV